MLVQRTLGAEYTHPPAPVQSAALLEFPVISSPKTKKGRRHSSPALAFPAMELELRNAQDFDKSPCACFVASFVEFFTSVELSVGLIV